MILFWHKIKEGETSEALLERALLAYCTETGKRIPRKKNRIPERGEFGKPYYPALKTVFPSVSHSGGYWAALFDNHPCGLDIEALTREHCGEAVIRRRFTPEEQALFPDVVPDAGRLFLEVWTRKEAYLKYTGEGLTRDLRSFSTAELLPDGRTVFRERMEPFYGEKTVTMRTVRFDETGLPLTGAVCAAPGELRILELPEKDEGELFSEAKELALDYLEAGVRTEAEVRKKLREKGVPEDTAEQTMGFLREYGFVNDEAYARRYTELAAEKGRGPVRIKGELERKGVSSELARRVLLEYEESLPGGSESEEENSIGNHSETGRETFAENALLIAQKMFEQSGASQLDDKLAAKILRRLASRGFSAGDSYGALENLRRELAERER